MRLRYYRTIRVDLGPDSTLRSRMRSSAAFHVILYLDQELKNLDLLLDWSDNAKESKDGASVLNRITTTYRPHHCHITVDLMTEIHAF